MLNAALVDHQIQKLIKDGGIQQISGDAIQPASIDLSIGNTLWQVAGIPSTGGAGGFKAEAFIDEFVLNSFSVTSGTITLNPTNVYLAELEGTFYLPEEVYAYANPKSSIGRVDLHCIIVTEGGRAFNTVPSGYRGKLYALLVAQSFPIQVTKGLPVAQLRLFQGKRLFLTEEDMKKEQKEHAVITGKHPEFSDNGAILHLDLKCKPSNLVSQRSGKPIDLLRRDQDPTGYFREKQINHGVLFLEPNEFVLATTIERVRVPNHLCAEMIAFQEEYGEIRTHYAGFFDPGFGYGKTGEVKDSGVVCEIRNIGSAPMMLAHGQPVCLLRYEQLAGTPKHSYGDRSRTIKSHYQGQKGVQLGKFFTAWPKKG